MSKANKRQRQSAAELTKKSAFKRAQLAEARLGRYRTIVVDYLATLDAEVLSLLMHQGIVTEEDMAALYALEQRNEQGGAQLELTPPGDD